MDPIEALLIKEYGIPADKAKNMAARIKDHSMRDPGVGTEAYQGVAGDELTRMRRLKMKFDKFTQIAEQKAKNPGYSLPAADEKFYRDVKRAHIDEVRNLAAQSYKTEGALANTPTTVDANMGRHAQMAADQELARMAQWRSTADAQSRQDALIPQTDRRDRILAAPPSPAESAAVEIARMAHMRDQGLGADRQVNMPPMAMSAGGMDAYDQLQNKWEQDRRDRYLRTGILEPAATDTERRGY